MKTTPSQTESFDAHPAVVRRWLEHLPRAHTGELARQLYQAMCSANRQQLSSKYRFHFLEAINEPLGEVLPALHRHYAGKPVPLSAKRQKVADLYYQLLKQVIIGYQRLITSSLELGRFGWKHTVTTAIHRIFGYHNLLLTNARQLYHPYPKGIWQQIYWLYMQVENHRLLNAKVPSLIDPSRKTTLATEFNKLLLQSMLSPNLFQPEELQAVLADMDLWAARVKVVERLRGDESQVYAFKLNTDVPPGLMAEQAGPEAPEFDAEMRFLLLGELTRVLEELTRQARPGVNAIRIARQRTMSRRALMLLFNAWARPASRQSTRKAVQGRLEMAIGMSAIHYVISNGRGAQQGPAHPPPSTGAEDVFLPVTDEPALNNAQQHGPGFLGEREGQGDVWETAYFVPQPSPPSWTESIQLKAYSYQHARVTNVSQGGFCVSLDRDRVERIQLNEWVAVRNRHGPWTLGRIRWLLCPTGGPVRAGIERLSTQVQPALLHLKAHSPHAQPIRCLLGNNGQAPVLYLPNLPVQLSGRMLDLEANGRLSRITLREQSFATPLGTAHLIERHIPEDRSANTAREAAPGEDDRYAAIWAQL